MNIVIHPTYLPNIATYVAILKADNVTFEVEDNFIKQTYRNRAYIYNANGRLGLNIPVIHTQKNRQKYRDVKIFNDTKWQELHWKSLLSAYRTSPFFEYYEDELYPLFSVKSEFILDFNLKCFEVLSECLQLDIKPNYTSTYQTTISNANDLRFLVEAKKEKIFEFEPYIQVFGNKYGFKSNLSILDLLFNEGPNALTYLENQSLKF